MSKLFSIIAANAFLQCQMLSVVHLEVKRTSPSEAEVSTAEAKAEAAEAEAAKLRAEARAAKLDAEANAAIAEADVAKLEAFRAKSATLAAKTDKLEANAEVSAAHQGSTSSDAKTDLAAHQGSTSSNAKTDLESNFLSRLVRKDASDRGQRTDSDRSNETDSDRSNETDSDRSNETDSDRSNETTTSDNCIMRTLVKGGCRNASSSFCRTPEARKASKDIAQNGPEDASKDASKQYDLVLLSKESDMKTKCAEDCGAYYQMDVEESASALGTKCRWDNDDATCLPSTDDADRGKPCHPP